jgi:hypothetical protein
MVLAAAAASAQQPVETEIPGVTAELLELRQHGGVLRLAIRFVNTADKEVAANQALLFSEVTLVDEKGGRKYYGLKNGNDRFLAGPMTDAAEGGRWSITLPAKADAIMWMLFREVPSGTVVTVNVPRMFPFDNVAVTEGADSKVFAPASARSTPSGLAAKLVSATRTAQGDVKLRLRIERTGAFEPTGFLYKDFLLFETPTRALYSLNKSTDGLYAAQPLTDKEQGGRFWPNSIAPGAPALMSLTFGGPPAGVNNVDLLIPSFVPMVGVQITDEKDAKRGQPRPLP